MMRFKELAVVGILAIFVAVIIISFQENDVPIRPSRRNEELDELEETEEQ